MITQLVGFMMVLCVILVGGWVGMGFKSNVDRKVHERIGWAALIFTGVTVYATLMINLGSS